MTSFTTRLTPVCWQAFDVVSNWVKVINQALPKELMWSLDLVKAVDTAFFEVLWENQDDYFDLDIDHIKGLETDSCQSHGEICHFQYGH